MTGPGFVNAHTHIYSGLAPFDMPPPARDPENFFEILERVWWRLDRALDVTSLHAAARWYVADALLHGTTTLIDHHESPNLIEGSLDVIADACASLGMRALLCYGATERNRGRAEARRGLAECERFILNNRRPHVRGLVGLHASFTVSHETLEEAADMCARLETARHRPGAADRSVVLSTPSDCRDRRSSPAVSTSTPPRCATPTRTASGSCRTRAPTRRTASGIPWHSPRGGARRSQEARVGK